MLEERKRIAKLVFTLESIESSTGWSLSHEDASRLCYSCKSPLFYIHIVWGIVEEAELFGIKVMGDEYNYHYGVREIGLVLYCAECGRYDEHYSKYFYPEDKVVCSLEDTEFKYVEMEEIKHCIIQWNKKGNFKPNYNSPDLRCLKRKFEEYEKKIKKKPSRSQQKERRKRK